MSSDHTYRIVRAHHRDEEGVALVFAMLAVIILAGLGVLFMTTATHQSRFTGNERKFETAIHAAEAGVDRVITNVNQALEYRTRYDSAGTPAHVYLEHDGCVNDPCDTEAEWLLAVANDPDTPVVKTGFGEAVGIRPLDADGNPMDTVFGVGYVPSRADAPPAGNGRVRYVKVGIEPGVFSPQHAFFANGDLMLGGSALTGGITGHVHSNKNVLLDGSNWKVDGNLTAVQDIKKTSGYVLTEEDQQDLTPDRVTGHARSGATFETSANAPIAAWKFREAHESAILNADSQSPASVDARWWDLCVNGSGVGEVRLPGETLVPCSGDLHWTSGQTSEFHGWTYDSSADRWNADRVVSGVFYVHESNARIGGGTGSVTVLASAERDGTPDETDWESYKRGADGDGGDPGYLENPPTTAGGTSGNIIIEGNPTLAHAIPGVQLVADRDIILKGQSGTTFEGLIAAHEQIANAGSAALNGAVFAEDSWRSPSEPTSPGSWVGPGSAIGFNDCTTTCAKGNMNVSYNGTILAALPGVTRLTSWDELNP